MATIVHNYSQLAKEGFPDASVRGVARRTLGSPFVHGSGTNEQECPGEGHESGGEMHGFR